MQSLPQVDVLRAGVDVFLTHGGQNSFTEAMANATPVVVCPGFGDQIINASRAEALGVGRKVDRPDCDAGREQGAAAAYQRDVAAALMGVLADPSCKEAVKRVAAELAGAGGVGVATKVILGEMQASAPDLLNSARNSGA
uniref:Uncharacterized protein n=1 Tax=Alexandrium catenella TaxID=2925 RepID=A0A7S1S597_ALECA